MCGSAVRGGTKWYVTGLPGLRLDNPRRSLEQHPGGRNAAISQGGVRLTGFGLIDRREQLILRNLQRAETPPRLQGCPRPRGGRINVKPHRPLSSTGRLPALGRNPGPGPVMSGRASLSRMNPGPVSFRPALSLRRHRLPVAQAAIDRHPRQLRRHRRLPDAADLVLGDLAELAAASLVPLHQIAITTLSCWGSSPGLVRERLVHAPTATFSQACTSSQLFHACRIHHQLKVTSVMYVYWRCLHPALVLRLPRHLTPLQRRFCVTEVPLAVSVLSSVSGRPIGCRCSVDAVCVWEGELRTGEIKNRLAFHGCLLPFGECAGRQFLPAVSRRPHRRTAR